MIQFRELLRLLKEAQLEFVVVGGLAAVLHGAAEPTRDLDVRIRLSPDSWTKVHVLLAPLHPRYALTPDRRPIELTPVITDLGRIDFLGAVPPLGAIDSLHTLRVHVDDLELQVLTIDDLITVQEYIRRPKDLEVAAELRAIKERTRS